MIDWDASHIVVPPGHHVIQQKILNQTCTVEVQAGAVLEFTDPHFGLQFRGEGSCLIGEGLIQSSANYTVWFYRTPRARVKGVTIRSTNVESEWILCVADSDDVIIDRVGILGPYPAPYDEGPNKTASITPKGIGIRSDGRRVEGIRISDCDVSGCGNGIVTGASKNLAVMDNRVISSTGQHGIYMSSTANGVCSGNTVLGATLVGAKYQAADQDTDDSEALAFARNYIIGCGSHGLLFTSVGQGSRRLKHCVAVDNVIINRANNPGVQAILAINVDGLVEHGNIISGYGNV